MTKTIPTDKLPANAIELFKLYVADAGNWSGTPLVGSNVVLLGEKEDRGLFSYLKRAGLIETWQDEENRKCYWLRFTYAGFEFAQSLGLNPDANELSGYRGWPEEAVR